VIDRGPYIAGREWDLTGATAELLGFNGLDFIDWTV
jgi:rare lipoprotein A (peptidoglycan hydrolase)